MISRTGGAVFDSNNSDELVVQGAGQINYDVKAGNVGSFEISASLAYRETVASPLEVSFGECSDESFSTVGLKIEKIKGLYGPDSGNNFKKDSYGVYQLGYKSDYGFGRVYANRAPTVGTADSNSDGFDDDPANADADGNPKYDKGNTYVDITVDTEMTFSSAPPQSQVRVVWSFEDLDDDSDSKMPSQSQMKIDPNGSAGDDNYN